MSFSSSSSTSSRHGGSLEVPKIDLPTNSSLKPFAEDDIDSLSDIPELNEAVNLPDKDDLSNLQVEPPVMSADFKPPPAYSSAPYSGSQSHDADDDSSQNTMIDDILITPFKTDMATQTPQKLRLTPLHDQSELRSMDYVAPVPSQILVQDQDFEKESWLQIEVSEPYNYKIERFKGPEQISVGPLDQTHLLTPLENNHNLKFLPVKFISEHFPNSVQDENIMGAIVDTETGKIYSIECSHPNGLPKPDSEEEEVEEEGEYIPWCSLFLLLRILGLILAFGALMSLILLSGPSSDESGVAALPLTNVKLLTTLPWSTTDRIGSSTSSSNPPETSTTNGAFARSISSKSSTPQATLDVSPSVETIIKEESSSVSTVESSSNENRAEVTPTISASTSTTEETAFESTLITTYSEAATTPLITTTTTTTTSTMEITSPSTSQTTTDVSMDETTLSTVSLTPEASSFDAMKETTHFEEFPNAIEDAFS